MKTYQAVFENALRKLNLSKKDVKDIDGEVRCAHMIDELISDTGFFEAFSGECIEDVVEWMEIPE